MENIQLNLTGSLILFILGAIVAIGFAIFIYRRTNPPIPNWLRNVLIVLRALALLIVLFIIFEPILKLSWKREEKPTVAVMLDTSASMTIADENISRAEKAKAVLNAPIFRGDTKDVNFEFYEFSHTLNPISIQQLDSLNFDADGTDLESGVKQLYDKHVNTHLTAIVMLSDGINNLGGNPIRFAEEMNVPIFPISVGKSVEQKDILVSKVTTNQITYVNSKVPVDVKVQSSGFSGQRIKVNLIQGSKTIDSKFVDLANLPESQLRLHFVPDQPGFKKFKIQIPVLENELTAINNERSFYVKVLKSRINVLFLSGAPGSDFTFIKRVLDKDPNIKTDFWVAKNRQRFYQGQFPNDPNQLKNYDCIILDNFPPENFIRQPVQVIADLLKQTEIPLFFIGGNSIDYRALDDLAAYLPVVLPKSEATEIEINPHITGRGLTHPVTRIDDDQFENQSLWQELPPVNYSVQNVKTLTGSEVLLDADPVDRKNYFRKENQPLLVVSKVGQRKSMAILGNGIWRWDFLMWGIGKSNRVFKQLLVNSIRWLINKEDSKHVRIYPDQEIFRSGQPITFTAEIYDENYQPLDGADVKLSVKGNSKNYELSLTGIGDGKYEGALQALEGGDYSYKGEATYKNIELEQDQGNFSVEKFNLEFLKTHVDTAMLRQLAVRTGGQVIADSSLSALDELLKFPSKEFLETREWQLWDKLYLLILAILILSIEWYIRKRIGML